MSCNRKIHTCQHDQSSNFFRFKEQEPSPSQLICASSDRELSCGTYSSSSNSYYTPLGIGLSLRWTVNLEERIKISKMISHAISSMSVTFEDANLEKNAKLENYSE